MSEGEPISGTNKSEANKPQKSSIGIVIAIIGLLGSLGGAWITTGARFDRELEQKESEVRALSARMDQLKGELQQAAELNATVKALSGRVDKVQGDVADVATRIGSLEVDLRRVSDSAKLEADKGFGRSAEGVKACKITISGRWMYIITLPRSATSHQCDDESSAERSNPGKPYYALGCIFSDRFVFGAGVESGVGASASAPSPNCGW